MSTLFISSWKMAAFRIRFYYPKHAHVWISPGKNSHDRAAFYWGCTSGGVYVPCVFTRMPGESYRRRLRSLLLYLYDVFRALINSLVCWKTFQPIFCSDDVTTKEESQVTTSVLEVFPPPPHPLRTTIHWNNSEQEIVTWCSTPSQPVWRTGDN